MMMLQCWELVPDKRPSFKTLYKYTSNVVEGLAGYLEMGFNPFAVGMADEAGMEQIATEGSEDTDEDDDTDEETMTTAATVQVIQPPYIESGDMFPKD